ncbi:ferritin-like protein [Massilia sp. MB5]|uniref:ferritin-like domain-containing protein n=1 Tax=unclassified Massilia TaxID=2609279 RepID=UPI00067E4B1F|nr:MULTISPECIES: ferritin-like protein [unclassified Massilia]AKU20835.1 hypothetical protein ACZ75_04275 [Massilia sp. NR 4-1]UMR29646.1 ferritin-like protein [Massilia sp. MB5]
MIRLHRNYVRAVRQARAAQDLFGPLQNAIELEHSTIPPYFTATASLVAGKNEAIAGLIRAITMQEMLHMCIASNILIAIGGQPQINRPGFVPEYPGPLPMHIGGPDFTVGIEAFSRDLVKQVFMQIEEPEQPIPVREKAEIEPEYETIGAFYRALQAKIVELGDGIFEPSSLPRQVVQGNWFPPDQLFAITGADSAVRAIDIIVLQGEGSSSSPYESPDVLAHFYRFGEIHAGRALVKTADGYAYAGAPIPFDDNGVYPLRPNCKLAQFTPGTQAHTRLAQFIYSYNSLLNALHTCFNGQPGRLDAAIGLMYSLRIEAVALVQTPVAPGSAQNVGPSFEYMQT